MTAMKQEIAVREVLDLQDHGGHRRGPRQSRLEGGVVNVGDGAGRNGSGPQEGLTSAADRPVVVFGRPPELEVPDDMLYPGLSGTTFGNRVALTFDDGPDQWTGDILDVLDEHDAKATFFVVGKKVSELPSPLPVEAIVRRGHELGNHTWSHANLADLGSAEVMAELADCSVAILDATGHSPYFYRAPFLNDPPAAKMAGLALGMLSVDADVIAGDWVVKDWRTITNNVTGGVKAGGRIVLLHDGVPADREGDRKATVKAVKAIVPWLKDHGYELVTVSDLLGRVDVRAA